MVSLQIIDTVAAVLIRSGSEYWLLADYLANCATKTTKCTEAPPPTGQFSLSLSLQVAICIDFECHHSRGRFKVKGQLTLPANVRPCGGSSILILPRMSSWSSVINAKLFATSIDMINGPPRQWSSISAANLRCCTSEHSSTFLEDLIWMPI